MIRCVRIWMADDGNSDFEEGEIDLGGGVPGDLLSVTSDVTKIFFHETPAGTSFEWHDAPARQFVITLEGTLDFETRRGAHFTIRAGDVLLAEDTTGSGHNLKMVGKEPWRRVYVVLKPGADVPFKREPSV